ncbi:TlpA family protein disulfide reductase [Psychroserpens sp.]|uniref:TlpA family protein disulfide reductase n=1 Tax=Psychroserpens sp. TaxID=2020870 RepID=UPI003C73C481
MKKLMIVFWALTIMACEQEPKIDYVVLSGTVTNSKAKLATVKGNDFKADLTIDEKGMFSDTLKISENGFFTFSIGREYTPMYLRSGSDINLKLDATKFDESLTYTGNGAVENNYLAQKTFDNSKKTANPVEFYANEETAFKKTLANIQATNEARLEQMTDVDAVFLSTEKQNLVYDHYAMLKNYAQRHGYYTKQENYKVSENFFPEDLKTMTFDNAKAYTSSESYKSMAFGQTLDNIFKSLGDDINKVTVNDLDQLNTIKIEPLKNDVIDYLGSFLVSPANENMVSIYEFLKDTSTSEKTKKDLTQTFEKNKNLVKGMPSPQFVKYENHKGGDMSLTDLKGKYVYVDVWATWCGPCIREIPSLKKVEQQFHNENIAFVSTSIDKSSDHEKWIAMVNDKNLGGVQLMADNDWNSKFVKDYAIQGIPRFILIDPNGNIVNADAPRPSDPKLISLLEEELKM